MANYIITFVNYDNTELQSELLEEGIMPSYSGEIPTKPSTAQYSYAFVGWSPEIEEVSEDKTYTAIFGPILNQYTVIWKNYDGTVLETDRDVDYGTFPTYNGQTPIKNGHTFEDWQPAVSQVQGDITYTASFTKDGYVDFKRSEDTDYYKYKDGIEEGVRRIDKDTIRALYIQLENEILQRAGYQSIAKFSPEENGLSSKNDEKIRVDYFNEAMLTRPYINSNSNGLYSNEELQIDDPRIDKYSSNTEEWHQKKDKDKIETLIYDLKQGKNVVNTGCNNECTGTCKMTCAGAAAAWYTPNCTDCTGTCYTVCSISCGQVCSLGCGATCTVSCGNTCTDQCGVVCKTTCGGSCEGSCGTSCSISCGSGCSNDCGHSCNGSCGGSCWSSCGGGCGNNCGGNCAKGCAGCGGICSGNCTGDCNGTCGDYCGSGCSGSEYKGAETGTMDCHQMCYTLCGGGCKGNCGTACANGCRTCGNSCGSGCGTGCYSGCGSDGCVASCQGGCGSGCSYGCKDDCSSTCGGACAVDCGGDCSHGCKNGCSIVCDKECANGCAVICKETCKSSCTETCTASCWNRGTSSGSIRTDFTQNDNRGCGQNCTTGCNIYCTGCSGNCAGLGAASIENSNIYTGDFPLTDTDHRIQITPEHMKIIWNNTSNPIYLGAKNTRSKVDDN